MLPANQLPMPQAITKPKVLIVEGHDADYFFSALLRYMKLTEQIQIINIGGVDQLRPYLKTMPAASGFNQVVSLGIIRDAEESAPSAFQAVCNGLEDARLGVPLEFMTAANSTPRVSVYILPDCENPGMLETLCLQAVEEDSVMPCVDSYLECLKEINHLPHNLHKARFHAFLASRKEPGLLLGQAAARKYLPWDHPAFDPIRQFIDAL